MKKMVMITALAALSFAHAEEGLRQAENPHNVYFGPIGFWQNFESKVKDEDFKETYKSNGYLGGAKLGYEHLKKDSIYFGLDGTFAAGRTEDKIEIPSEEDKDVSIVVKHDRTVLWGNAESRLGYNFGEDSYRVSPFVGIGWNYTKPDVDEKTMDISLDWFYGTAGFKSAINVTPGFDLGLNAKAMYNFYNSVRNKNTTEHPKDKSWGYELGLPFTWHLGQAQKWDIQLEPYFADLSIKDHLKQTGARLIFNYKF